MWCQRMQSNGPRKKNVKTPLQKGGVFLRMCFLLMVVFGILGNPGILDISKDPVCRQVCLVSGMPEFFEVVLHPEIILKYCNCAENPSKKCL